MTDKIFYCRTESGKHLVFYPTLYSITKRIELAEELGTDFGLSECYLGNKPV